MRDDGRGRPEEVKIIKVIEVVFIRGKGTDDDPVRRLKQYWTIDGELIATSEDEYA